MSMDASSVLVRDYGTCSSELVLHGSDADTRWPWQATVRENGDPMCAGSLISAGWVLCLASCVTTSNPAVYSVQLGTQAGSGSSSPDGQRLVARIIRHPAYAHSPSTHDIALIQLAEPVPFTSSIQPICLPEPLHLVPSGTTCWTAGSEPTGSAAPQALEWTVASAASCSHLIKDLATCAQYSLSIKPAHQMVAGGAFVCPGKNGLLYIEGIIPCMIKNQTTHPYATFTMVAPFVPWMQSYLLT
ncbi:prostasin-like [Emydura macquarii macquarii]|uniref:prostasin-like n=1 Tax=Emydura macquarii macquarii TaxID=1129001 RepID=UPI00352B4894